MIEYITAYTANDPLAVRILPGTAWGNLHCFNTHVFDALLHMLTVDRVAVSQTEGKVKQFNAYRLSGTTGSSLSIARAIFTG
jgi:hypothetical protein